MHYHAEENNIVRLARRRSTATLNSRNTSRSQNNNMRIMHVTENGLMGRERNFLLSHTKNCKVPKRKRTLQLISDELPHPPDLKLNKCRLYSAQIKRQQLLRYQTKRASDGRIRCRNRVRTCAPKIISRFKHPQSRIQI